MVSPSMMDSFGTMASLESPRYIFLCICTGLSIVPVVMEFRAIWVDFLTTLIKCPIAPRQTFTYNFMASEVGTRWYHGHGSGIKMDGLYGAIIVQGSEN